MRGFVVGVLVGLFLGSVVVATASQFSQGYLNGWDVVDASGRLICSDPYVTPSVREIECE